MRPSLLRSSLVVLCLASVSLLSARQDTLDPESVIRQLVRAMYANDVKAYNQLTTEHAKRGLLTDGGSANRDALRRLDEDPGGLQLRELRPVLFMGRPVEEASQPKAGATALFLVAHGGGPMVVPLVRLAGGWKVDIRWWVVMFQMARGDHEPTGPDRSIRSMLAAMLRLDRSAAVRYLTDSRNLELLFAGAPRFREPSGVLDAAVEEMPLVEIGAGEFYPMPTGRIVEGGSTEDRKVLVGLFGPIEMPFVARRIDGNWRIEAEPYFGLMMR